MASWKLQGVKESTIIRLLNHYGGAESLRGGAESLSNVTCTFFSTVNLLPKDLRFERGAPNLFLSGAI